ncbi:hypothetical protein GCM10020000_33250 [Streptomyces olivoverticillatus]
MSTTKVPATCGSWATGGQVHSSTGVTYAPRALVWGRESTAGAKVSLATLPRLPDFCEKHSRPREESGDTLFHVISSYEAGGHAPRAGSTAAGGFVVSATVR